MPRLMYACCVLLLCVSRLQAEKKAEAGAKTVEQIAEAARKSVVVITQKSAGGKREGLGTGFVVAADGLIATNLHVIGEGRSITVELPGGKRHEVTTVHAFDRSLDLALIRIDAKDLTPLELGDSDTLKDGQAVVAIGNPHGLKRSVVAGVVSAQREIDGRPMIQLAIPIEPGNSGGPLLDMQGRVHGILTMKSLVTENLGFAVAVNSLKTLLKKPNPVLMARWLGTLDPAEWQPLMGARWRQRGGHVLVDGPGSGFGGRSLCLSPRLAPALPFEIAVTVKLDDEAGAAGLAWHADGGDRHYGFYPTGGQLRLTRFDGPDVLTWKILQQEKSPHYHPGEWNTLKVRVEKDKIQCFVNDHLAIESDDAGLTEGKLGLAKFRDTRAEFKSFQVGKKLPATALAADVAARILKSVGDVAPQGPPNAGVIDTLVPEAASLAVLRERAKLLEQQAAQLRQLALAVHHKRVQTELIKLLQGKEDDIDLIHAALLIARLDNDELDVEAYRKQVARMARELADAVPKEADEKARREALDKFLFAERGYHGSRSNYYSRRNSYLNEVIDDREGIPITLSVIYMELARRIGLKVVGVGLPGHFVVRHLPAKGEPQLIDPYEGGQALSREEASKRVLAITERPLEEAQLAPVSKRAIVTRMLHNLTGVAGREEDAEGLLRYLDTILMLDTDSAQDRWMRAVLRAQTGRRQGSIEDTDWLLDHRPEGMNLDRVKEFRRLLDRPEK